MTYSHIVTLNAVIGSKIAVFSGHNGWVRSLTFSPDGTLLVSGSDDGTIKLWDMQTGGVVKTFGNQHYKIYSVSISVDCATIASGFGDNIVHLWDIQTGECHCIIQQRSCVDSVQFFPLDPQHFISISGGKVWEWNIDGHKIVPEYDGFLAAFSLDGTKFVLCSGGVVQVQSFGSKTVMAEFHMDNAEPSCCCFSPDGRLVAIAASHTAYVWDITNSEPCLIGTFVSHANSITSLVFSSPTSLISASGDRSMKFWQIETPSSPDTTDPQSIPHNPPIKSITLQAKDGIAISSDSDGIVKIWDLLTGLCKASFKTPAKGSCLRDVKLIDDRLVLVWYAAEKVHIWDVEKGELLQIVDAPWDSTRDLRISGDGSRVLCMEHYAIHAWYLWTGKVMGKVGLPNGLFVDAFLTTDSSKVWVKFLDHHIEGWDFGVPDSFSIKHCMEPQSRPYLDFIGGIRKWRSFLPGIEDTIIGKEIFRLPLGYAAPTDAQWDGQYLVAGYDTGEVLILDCNYALAH